MPAIEATIAGSTSRPNPYEDTRSLEFGFRSRRFVIIRRLIETVLSERDRCEIVDLGGTETYWRIGQDFIDANRHRIGITLVNTEPQRIGQPDVFTFVQLNVAEPGVMPSRRFDLVHSNSVIEHVGTWRSMQNFADNVRRLADRHYVQTPNYWFPYEPHFRVPGFQYLPERAKVSLLCRRALGFFPLLPKEEAIAVVRHHTLLSTRQMRRLFPESAISHEKLLGMNKSILAIRDAAPVRPGS